VGGGEKESTLIGPSPNFVLGTLGNSQLKHPSEGGPTPQNGSLVFAFLCPFSPPPCVPPCVPPNHPLLAPFTSYIHES